MAFDPNKYKVKEPKPLPVLLLLDTSGSMYGDKIENLYNAVVQMTNTFAAEALKETVINVGIITFGASVDRILPFTPVGELIKTGIPTFDANGMTPMGMALTMAKDIIEDRDETPSKVYRPAVVLVSDGQPNDEWERPLANFIGSGRSSKCQRMAVAIGADADKDVLEEFTGDPAMVFYAEDAADIVSSFKKVTMSVSASARSRSAGALPAAKPAAADEDEEDF